MLTLITIITVILSAYFFLQIRRYQKIFRVIEKRLGHIPSKSLKLTINPFTGLAHILPRYHDFNVGGNFLWEWKHDLFKKMKSDVVPMTTMYPPSSILLLADACAIKEVMNNIGIFQKPSPMYAALGKFGANVGTTHGEAWKRHRRITQGAFKLDTIKLSWKNTCDIIEQMFESWGDREDVLDVEKLMMRLTLNVICASAFSQKFPWREQEGGNVPEGHTLSFLDALRQMLETVMLYHMVPTIALNYLPIKKFKLCRQGFKEFRQYCREFFDEAKALGPAQENKDLLHSLIEASESESVKTRLTFEEVMGNMFVFLFAGHETTSNALTFILGLLSQNPEVQEWLRNILNKEGYSGEFGTVPVEVEATFLEGLRLFTTAPFLPRVTAERAMLPTENHNIQLHRGTFLVINSVALHRNPLYWGEDADEFKPTRFIDTETYQWPRHAFLGFASGTRTCPGQKFAINEGCTILAALIQNYKIEPLETLNEIPATASISLNPGKMSLAFTKIK